MDKQDIIAWAREACDEDKVDAWQNGFWTLTQEELERFAKLVRDDYSNKHANLWLDRCHKFMLDEREACEKVAAEHGTYSGEEIAAAIRARGNQ